MDHSQGTSVMETPDSGSGRRDDRGAGGRAPAKAGAGLFNPYKPEQGVWTRWGSVCGAWAIIAWGGYFLSRRLSIFEGDESWRLLVIYGLPIALVVGLGLWAWRLTFAHPGIGDFMIATEGEMKKVNWSSRREVIGSTKVVIVFTLLMAMFLFGVDVVFQAFFSWLGILKT